MDNSSFDFWQNHSLRFLEMAFRTDKRETLERPDGYGKRSRECGDTLEIFLMVRDGKITSASFETNGCLYSAACANTVVYMAEGKTLEEAREIKPEHIIDYLETLPAAESHCARLAVRSLHAALADVRDPSLEHDH
jgi:nitrogen fixation protein NifU and related proteins